MLTNRYMNYFTQLLNVNKGNLTIKSENGAAVTIVQTPNPGDHVFKVTASGVSIIGFTVRNATGRDKGGIFLSGSNNCVIENNICSNNFHGIYLYSSSNNTLINNTCENNSGEGIHLRFSSNNNLTNNTCENNSRGGHSQGLSHYNNFTNNTYRNNRDHGIFLECSSYNNLTKNVCVNNSTGIYLIDSSNNVIKNNLIALNEARGIELTHDPGLIIRTKNTLIIGNTITGNPIGIEFMSEFQGENTQIHYNNVFKNTDYGILNNTAILVDATLNWWGHPSGPYHPTENPYGRGDRVSDYVEFEPWLRIPKVQAP